MVLNTQEITIMKIKEITEADFMGRTCTKDCSGHRAGWEWEQKNQTNQKQQTPSTSFNNGTEIAISQRKQAQLRANKTPPQKPQTAKQPSG